MIDLLDDDVRHDIEVIASFDEDEIGSRMTTNCIIIQKNVTVKEAMSSLICQAAKNDNISTIFVVSSQHGIHHRTAQAVLFQHAHALNGAAAGAALKRPDYCKAGSSA